MPEYLAYMTAKERARLDRIDEQRVALKAERDKLMQRANMRMQRSRANERT